MVKVFGLSLKRALALAIGVFEAVVWTLPIPRFSIHHGPLFPFRALNGFLNSFPSIFCGAFGAIAGRNVYAPHLLTSFWMQTYFWWIPYITGGGSVDRAMRLSLEFAGKKIITVLPNLYDPNERPRIVPSLEHTIMYAATIATLVVNLRNGFARRAHPLAYWSSAAFHGIVPTLTLFFSSKKARAVDGAALIIWIGYVSSVFVVYKKYLKNEKPQPI